MMKTTIAALMMALALTACNKSDSNTPSSGDSSSSSTVPGSSGSPPAGLSGLGGNTKK